MTKQQLQAAVRAARVGNKRGQYSTELRTAVVDYCREGRASGIGWSRLSDDLGLNRNQLQVWLRGSRTAAKGRLRAVRVVNDAAAPSAGTLRLELAGGGVVTGLSVHDLVALVQELR